MKQKKRTGALRAITLILCVSIGAIWLAGMYCLTSVTAEYSASRFYENFNNYADGLMHSYISYNRAAGLELMYENFADARMWSAAAHGGGRGSAYISSFNAITDEHPFMRLRRYDSSCYGALMVFDSSGNMLVSSNEDYFFFEYMTEEQWLSGGERSGNNMRVFFDREKLAPTAKKFIREGKLSSKAIVMRFTGSYKDDNFIPTEIEYVDRNEFTEKTLYTTQHPRSTVVQELNLDWISIYPDSAALEDDQSQVTLYTDRFDICYAESSPGFRYLDKKYSDAADLAATLGPKLCSTSLGSITADHQKNTAVAFSGKAMIIPTVSYCYTIGDNTYYDSSYPYVSEEDKSLDFYVLSVVYFSPWQAAFNELVYVYIVSLLLAAGLITAIRAIIKRHLFKTVSAVGNVLLSSTPCANIPYPYPSDKWHESHLLLSGYEKHQADFQKQKDEIARLNTALEYASEAEQRRKRMISDLTHELKTPLAVLRSYAEGLKEHIAEDKRDKYIDVILSQIEQTDGMILSMLELSRLEAGKVKLTRDEFDMGALTADILERFKLMAQNKELTINLSIPQKCLVLADERRIAQVIENLISNSVKYTPHGGNIEIHVYRGSDAVIFKTINDCEALSDNDLAHIFEPFYRADSSRSSEGTGLGLAIAKNIVELHGGKMIARVLKERAAFGFHI